MVSLRVKPFFWMMLGVLTTVVLIIFIDVQIILSKTDFSNIASTPNMAPQMLYYFLPFIYLAVAFFSILANYIISKIEKINLTNTRPFYLGLSYGLILSFTIFLNLEISVILSFILSLVLMTSSLLLVSEKLIEKTL